MSLLPTFSNIKLSTLYNNQILLVKICRPSSKNAIDTATAYELKEAFNHFNINHSLKVAIITGEGDTFCSGADLKEVSLSKSDPKLAAFFTARFSDYGMGPLGPTHSVSQKPVIAAVCGHAVAGGLELAIWADMIVSHKSAAFGVYCRRFSVPLLDGGTVRLARIIGYSRAMDMILTGRGINGSEAFSWGLVNRLVEKSEDVFDEAAKLAKQLCDLPQECMRSDRLSLIESVFSNMERDLRNEMRLGMRIVRAGATAEGAARFVEQKEGRHGNAVSDPKLKENLVKSSKL